MYPLNPYNPSPLIPPAIVSSCAFPPPDDAPYAGAGGPTADQCLDTEEEMGRKRTKAAGRYQPESSWRLNRTVFNPGVTASGAGAIIYKGRDVASGQYKFLLRHHWHVGLERKTVSKQITAANASDAERQLNLWVQQVRSGRILPRIPGTFTDFVEGIWMPQRRHRLAGSTMETECSVWEESALRLQVGESKILSAEDLACVQLSAAVEDYALGIASLSGDRTLNDAVLRFQNADPALGASMAMAGLSTLSTESVHVREHSVTASMEGASGPNALTPFDDYADAEVGDTLQFVDWNDVGSALATTKEEVPTYEALVVAATPGQLIVADLRELDAASFSTPDVRARFQRAAELLDAYGLRAVRATVDPDLVLPDGAGGRVVTIIRPLPASVGGTIVATDLRDRNWSSNMFTTVLASSYANGQPGSIAGTIIHEMAHLTDALPEARGTGARSAGWYAEAVASWAEDVAARMSLGSESPEARRAYGGDANVIASRIARAISWNAHSESPYGPVGSSIGAAGPGSYDRGARILRFAAERLGQAGFTNANPLHQRLAAKSPGHQGDFTAWIESWGIEAIAAELGMSVADLLEQSMVADLTDDLLPAAVVAAYNVPQLDSWNHTPQQPGAYEHSPGRVVNRSIGLNASVTLPAGAYASWYIKGDGPGLSIEATDVHLQPHHQVRLTRVR